MGPRLKRSYNTTMGNFTAHPAYELSSILIKHIIASGKEINLEKQPSLNLDFSEDAKKLSKLHANAGGAPSPPREAMLIPETSKKHVVVTREKNCWNGKENPAESEMIEQEQQQEIIGERQKRRRITKINNKNSTERGVSVNVKVNTGGQATNMERKRNNQQDMLSPQGRVYVQVEIRDKNGQTLPPDR